LLREPFLQFQIHVGLPQKSLIFKANLITCIAANRSALRRGQSLTIRSQERLCRSLEADFGGEYASLSKCAKSE
jgi:hypothetical protein